jgi:FAD/FMN-containing dehydrogenase
VLEQLQERRPAVARHERRADEFGARASSDVANAPEERTPVTSTDSRTVIRSLDDLRATLRGRVIAPTDAEYDAARQIALGGSDPRPAAIVRVADADDVVHTIAHARAVGAELAVRGGGHSSAGHGTVDGGIVIDLRDLRRFELDTETRTAWADAGLTAGEVTQSAAEHDLAIGFGDTATVGIGGITLGGGIGYLVRKHGLTIDSLLAAEIVTPDGQVLTVDADHHPDLFWALRGGGGNFGVVTRFRYQLHALGQVVGGMLILPATPDTIAGFMAEADAAADELSGIANVMACPPMPFVAAEHHGAPVIMALLCWSGAVEDAEAAYAPFRALAEPLADMVRPIRYPEMYPPEDPDYHPTVVAHSMFVDRIGREEAEAIVAAVRASDAPMCGAQLRVLGGAAARVPVEATAFAHRASRIMVHVFSLYEGEEERPRHVAWVSELRTALQQSDTGAYVNFLADEGPDRVRAAYPGATWDRLVEVKRRYDPDNVFRRNQNVPPAT